ncbi:hypothetical protein AUS18_29440 [Escherichia coli]|nr:hypothetical protein BX75_21480 [Escherichia coli O26:NM str. 2010C-4788]EZG66213.1 hypothetical protein BX78_07590 [Escherichia coli O26:H11 str. 2010C-4819]EZG96062.1 hypothetical protein BX98_12460 [Escherichia coli O26:H11 str. 2011C-3387]EZH13621.1 hypothetical protein BY06_09215 [Escherichia coli O26:H11 str. 2011C-3655]EZH31405.1 hypothetical protein BX28_04365 [Escherichia coli O26:H11 str. 2009C-4760]EZH46399.1 hypothetical protein BX41_05520 [Escherichia coli O26:H11 str. 2010C-34
MRNLHLNLKNQMNVVSCMFLDNRGYFHHSIHHLMRIYESYGSYESYGFDALRYKMGLPC